MVKGSCLCGTVTWEMQPPFERMSHCHCSMCRKTHGAPFATFVAVRMNLQAVAMCLNKSSNINIIQ